MALSLNGKSYLTSHFTQKNWNSGGITYMRTFDNDKPRPVAFATPTGGFKVARAYRWIPEGELRWIEMIEEDFRENIAEERREQERRRLEAQPFQGSGQHPVTLGSRRASMLARNLPDGSIRKFRRGRDSSRSRTHSRNRDMIQRRQCRLNHPRWRFAA